MGLVVNPVGCVAATADPILHPMYDDHHLRRSHLGVGSCSDAEFDIIRIAYRIAAQVVRAADEELRFWFEEQPTNINEARAFWDFSVSGRDECSLSHWFGASDAPRFGERFGNVYSTIKSWSYRFRHGFYGPGTHRPVYFRCRQDRQPDYLAVHASLNVITLYGPWFDLNTPWERAVVIIHEMGHLSRSGLQWVIPGLIGMGVGTGVMLTHGPRDRRNVVCEGYSENKCYGFADNDDFANPFNPFQSDSILVGPNPRALAVEFNAGGSEARRDMMDNIDIYVCYMWNRWVDRGYCRVEAS
jgi:hypothetical protein